MWGSSQAQIYHMRWFERHLPADGSVRIRSLDMGLVGLSIAGPHSRELLAHLTDEDVSNAGFPFLAHRSMDIAPVPAMINRVTYTGDLGYEIWVTPEYQRRLYAGIKAAGRNSGSSISVCAHCSPAAREELADLVSRAAADLRAVRGWPRPLRRFDEERLHRP